MSRIGERIIKKATNKNKRRGDKKTKNSEHISVLLDKNTLFAAILTQERIYEPEEEADGMHVILGVLNDDEKKIYSLWSELIFVMDERDRELEKMKKEDLKLSKYEVALYEMSTDRIEDMAKVLYGFLFASIKYRIKNCPDGIEVVKGFKIIRYYEVLDSNN